MDKKWIGLIVAVGLLASAVTGWAQTNPTNLTVIRKSDNSIWKRTCDGISSCSDWTQIGGGFSVQPTLTWDPSIQKYILVGIGNNQTNIWRTTFDANGTWVGVWTNITGTSGGSPSPVGIAGGPLQPQTISVNCSATPPQSLQAAIDSAQTGNIIDVTGTCNENVVIPEEKQRLTLNGQSGAIVQGASTTDNVLFVRGREILIQNFEITGGFNGIVVRGSTAVINGNNIHNTGANGIVVEQTSLAVVTNNNIHDNPYAGIMIMENSTARIGFTYTIDPSPSTNTIQNNGGRGIEVSRTSSARIVGNIIANNTRDGIGIFRLSQADIAYNTINHNANGIIVGGNSGVQVGEDNPTNYFGYPNITTDNNTGFGIACSMGGYVQGHLGSEHQIWGESGQTSISGSCPNNLVP